MTDQALESKLFHKNDFIWTEDYVMRLRPKGEKKFIEELDRTFSQPVKYQGKNLQWSILIQIKGQEFSSYLTSKQKNIDFSKPEPHLERVDSQDLRQKILDLSYGEWEKMGFSKGTLHYMKKNVKANKPFTPNRHVRERIEGIM